MADSRVATDPGVAYQPTLSSLELPLRRAAVEVNGRETVAVAAEVVVVEVVAGFVFDQPRFAL